MSAGTDLVSLVKQHQAGVWRYLRMLGCDPAQADELTQETFVAVLERPFQDYHPAATAAYLRKVARNLFLTSRRRLARGGAAELSMASLDSVNLDQLDASWSHWADRDGGESMLEALADCLQALAERSRLALDLRFRERQSRAQIATALGLSEDGAKNLLQRAKQQLRVCIEGKLQ